MAKKRVDRKPPKTPALMVIVASAAPKKDKPKKGRKGPRP
jgi:hypothetical protein